MAGNTVANDDVVLHREQAETIANWHRSTEADLVEQANTLDEAVSQ